MANEPNITVEDLLDQLLAPVQKVLSAIPEAQRVPALAAGRVAGISAPVGMCIATLVSITRRDWFRALGQLREALQAGLDHLPGRFAFQQIINGLDADLAGNARLRVTLFKPSSLALLRVTEVELNHPGLPLVGPELEIVSIEKRPMKELQAVFLGLLDAETVSSSANMEKLVVSLQRSAADPTALVKDRAAAFVRLAVVAAQANDFRSVCEYIARAFQIAPQSPEVLTAAEFTWVMLNAMARDRVLADPAYLPTATSVLATVKAALAYETLHPAGTPEQIAARNQTVEEMFP